MKFIFLILTLTPLTSHANELSRCMELFALTDIPKVNVTVKGTNPWYPRPLGQNYASPIEFWTAEVQSVIGLKNPSEFVTVTVEDGNMRPGAGLDNISIEKFDEPSRTDNQPSEGFLNGSKATYIHEYAHTIIAENMENFVEALAGYSNLRQQARMVFGRIYQIDTEIVMLKQSKDFKDNDLNALAKMEMLYVERASLSVSANEIVLALRSIINVTVPYEELLADLAAVLTIRDLSAMEKSLAILHAFNKTGIDNHIRDFSASYEVDSWFDSSIHLMFSPVRSYLGTVITKYGWEKSEFIFKAVFRAAGKRLDEEQDHPEQMRLLPSVRNQLFIEAIEKELNGSI